MIITGGTYREICLEPNWDQIYGSGLRACMLIALYDKKQSIEYHTIAGQQIKGYLEFLEPSLRNVHISIERVSTDIEFYYDHPLRTPIITPRPDTISTNQYELTIPEAQCVLSYGLLEGSFSYSADRVVYDPQSPANPVPFSQTGAKANKLVTIVNFSEAKLMSGCSDIQSIKRYFLEKENCHALILKMGAKGALLVRNHEEDIIIPVFKTDQVWPIGSGDVFSAFFAHNWFNGVDITQATLLASKATAVYCNSRELDIRDGIENFSFDALTPNLSSEKKVYLAGPFFTFTQRWLVNEIRKSLLDSGLKVFSPYHDIGFGSAQDVAQKDLDGLKESSVVIAILDGLDSGTLFEVGYATSLEIPVIGLAQNETEESLKMLEGSGCSIESDLTTAIYKTFWTINTE